MNWDWELSSRAEKDLERLDKTVRRQVFDALDRLARELTAGAELTKVKKLRGTDVPDEWRVRTGDFRARFRKTEREVEVKVDGKPKKIDVGVVVVLRVGNRRDVYQV